MWTTIAAPFLSFLPRPLRDSLPTSAPIRWTFATILSALAESVAAFIALVYWHSYSVTHWAEHSITAIIAAHPEAAIPPGTEGFAGLVLVAMHPFTWLITFFAIEGVVRLLAAAFTATILGTFPLYALDRLFLLLRPGHNSAAKNLPDEIFRSTDGPDEILEIHSALRKPQWNPPRIIRIAQPYYRLESTTVSRPPRPFHFTLRRLPAGVPSPSVLDYSPTPTPNLANQDSSKAV